MEDRLPLDRSTTRPQDPLRRPTARLNMNPVASASHTEARTPSRLRLRRHHESDPRAAEHSRRTQHSPSQPTEPLEPSPTSDPAPPPNLQPPIPQPVLAVPLDRSPTGSPTSSLTPPPIALTRLPPPRPGPPAPARADPPGLPGWSRKGGQRNAVAPLPRKAQAGSETNRSGRGAACSRFRRTPRNEPLKTNTKKANSSPPGDEQGLAAAPASVCALLKCALPYVGTPRLS
jgi:hypothetical protein